MLKKILLLVALAGAAVMIAKKVKDANEERDLWHEATTSPDLR
jgi:hypothetical protein